MEKLHELEEEGGFDLIVVDTPPSRHALDFLDAPQRLLRLLDNRIFRLLMVPTRTGPRIAGAAVQAFLRTISRVVGSEVVNDIVAFFRAFEGMEEGFRERAKKVVTLLGEPTTRFVLITSPRRDAVEEARFFAEKIGDHNLAVDALIVNRVHPRFGTEHASGLRARAASLRDLRVSGKEAMAARARLAAQYANLADFNEIAKQAEPSGPLRQGGSAAVASFPTSPMTSTTSTRSPRSVGSCSTLPVTPIRSKRPDCSGPAPQPATTSVLGVDTILVAAEASWIRNQVQVAFVEPGQRIIEVKRARTCATRW